MEMAVGELEERGACTNTREARVCPLCHPTSESSVGPAQEAGWERAGGCLPREVTGEARPGAGAQPGSVSESGLTVTSGCVHTPQGPREECQDCRGRSRVAGSYSLSLEEEE